MAKNVVITPHKVIEINHYDMLRAAPWEKHENSLELTS